MMQNNSGQNYRNRTNPNSGYDNKVNDANNNTDGSEAGAIRGMW